LLIRKNLVNKFLESRPAGEVDPSFSSHVLIIRREVSGSRIHYRLFPPTLFDVPIETNNELHHNPSTEKNNLSTVLGGQAVGLKEVEEGIWLVSSMDYEGQILELRGS
jgi:hypothetical protein